jgi:transketolase
MLYYMRDTFFEQIYKRMSTDKKIFFITADVGAPVIDKISSEFSDRFINVGISEQNMINVVAGLAMEGFEVYAYGIASFFLRCIDQIRNSLLLTNQMNKLNVNLLATGKGVSYETAGPAHHCMEDLPVLNIFPGMELFVPSDSVMAREMAIELAMSKGVKYFCFDGKKLENLYVDNYQFELSDGFIEHTKGTDICIISQGSILSLALEVANNFKKLGIDTGVLDLFASLKSVNYDKFAKIISQYKKLIVIEEGYRDKGLLINTVKELTYNISKNISVYSFGFDDQYVFEVGPRTMHYSNCGLSIENVVNTVSGK